MAASRQNVQDDDYDLFEVINGVKILRDGARWRPPLRMRDAASVMDTWIDQNKLLHDATSSLHDGHGGRIGQRPGFLLVNDASDADKDVHEQQMRAIDQAYADYENNLTTAYLHPPTGEGSGDFIGQREGDLCTINGFPGRLVCGDDGELTCMPDNPSGADDTRTVAEIVRDHEMRMSEEHAAADLALSNAWRRP